MLYEIQENGSGRRVAVALCDLLPGQMVLTEDVPLMSYSADLRSCYDYPEPFISAFCIFITYKEGCSTSSQDIWSTLLEPPSGRQAEVYRRFARTMKYKPQNEDEPRLLNEEEIELLASFATAVDLSQFLLTGQVLIFNDINRFSHSCIPNCRASVVNGQSCVCYTIMPVKKGEALTVSHNSVRDMESTAQRRFKYAVEKQVTCHCPRCDAPGDDTRQFECFDAHCEGVMMVCQPLSKERIPGNTYNYECVEYVEPHLLPCTVCHCTAPADYQSAKLKEESALKVTIQKPYWELIKKAKPQDLPALFDEITSLQVPVRHSLSVKILRSQFYAYLLMTVSDADKTRYLAEMEDTARLYMENYNGFLRYPHDTKIAAFTELGMMSMACKFSVSVDLLQAALRMTLVTQGRHMRKGPLEQELALVLEEHNHTADCQECFFCGESPLRAVLTLNRCGRCRKVAYCSVGCQKAHWKVHKKKCFT